MVYSRYFITDHFKLDFKLSLSFFLSRLPIQRDAGFWYLGLILSFNHISIQDAWMIMFINWCKNCTAVLLCAQFCVQNYPKILLICLFIYIFYIYVLKQMVLHVQFLPNTQVCEFVSGIFYLELMALNFTEVLIWLWIAFKYC